MGGENIKRRSTARVRWDGSVGTERRGAAQSFGCKLDVEEEESSLFCVSVCASGKDVLLPRDTVTLLLHAATL